MKLQPTKYHVIRNKKDRTPIEPIGIEINYKFV